MKKESIKPQNFKARYSLKFVLIFLILMSGVSVCAQFPQSPPQVDFKAVTWRDKDISNLSGLSQNLSGDEWWYSHKNLYDANGKHIGYIACGYIADLVHPGDETKIRLVFNEGTDSPHNFYPGTGSLFQKPYDSSDDPDKCGDFYDNLAHITNTTTNINEDRTQFRGMVARLDLKGNMIWCRLPNINGGGLQELVVNGNDIYVVGTHDGAKNLNFSNNNTNRTFLSYNPVSAATKTANIFSKTTYTDIISNNGTPHMYVAKYDVNGNKQWESLYGSVPFSGNKNDVWTSTSTGYDIIYNSFDNNLYAVGQGSTEAHYIYVAKINPSNGFWLEDFVIPHPSGFNNANGDPLHYMIGLSVCQASSTGIMAISSAASYTTSINYDKYRGFVHCITPTPSLSLYSGWTQNPRTFSATTGVDQSSNIWEVNFHSAKQEILVGLITNCNKCNSSGNNSGEGKIYRIKASDGTLSNIGTNPSLMGNINAFDLRIGVIETSDGGFAALSSRRNNTFTISLPALGTFSACPKYASSPGIGYTATPNSINQDNPYGTWDTDPVIVKFDSNGNPEWEWSEDIVPGRTRQATPGDYKHQECMYKLTEAWDGGLVASGNCSFNHDDNYMVKLYSKCASQQTFDITSGITVSSSSYSITNPIKIKGVMTIQSGGICTISGTNALVQFADSKMLGYTSNIVIEPGGKLIIRNGATVTSMDNNTCPGSMWDGIAVMGTFNLGQGATNNYTTISNQGFLDINGSTLSNARSAVSTGSFGPDHYGINTPGQSGGVIRAVGANFINNNRDVQIFEFNNVDNAQLNKCLFQTCHFLTTAEINNREEPVFRIFMERTRNVGVFGNEFTYSAGSAYDPLHRGWGIKSNDAAYTVKDYCATNACSTFTQSQFTDYTQGIEADNCNSLRIVNVDHALFKTTYNGSSGNPGGITLHSTNTATLSRNSFTLSYTGAYGISVNNSKYYSVSNNTLTSSNGNGVGIYLCNSGAGSHKAYRNTISGMVGGIYPEFENSGSFSSSNDPNVANDGLIMNCNTFTSNIYDIAMLGDNVPGYIPSVRQNQGNSLTNPKLLVRNRYAAGNSNTNQWYIENSPKQIYHPANSNTITQPCYSLGLGSPLIYIVPTSTSINFASHCLENESSPPTNTAAACATCERLGDINTALGGAISLESSLNSTYNSSLDGGNTQALLDAINSGTINSADLTTLMLGFSPYVSDTAMVTYFSDTDIDPDDAVSVHDNNKPVNDNVWNAIVARAYPDAEFNTIIDQQDDYPISARRAMEDEWGRSKSELQFIYAEKLNYYLQDSLAAAPDTVISLLSANTGKLPDAKIQRVSAYADGGYFSRAFAYVDSLSNISGFEERMTLEQALLELDTAATGVYKILSNSTLHDVIAAYAVDSSKAGYWLAKGVMRQVYNTKSTIDPNIEETDTQVYGMNLQYRQPSGGGARQAIPSANSGAGGGNEPGTPFGSHGTKPGNSVEGLNNLSIYPNPTRDNFYLVCNSGLVNHETRYSLRDILGKELIQGMIKPGTANEVVTHLLNNGIYFVTLIQDNKVIGKQKIVIMK